MELLGFSAAPQPIHRQEPLTVWPVVGGASPGGSAAKGASATMQSIGSIGSIVLGILRSRYPVVEALVPEAIAIPQGSKDLRGAKS